VLQHGIQTQQLQQQQVEGDPYILMNENQIKKYQMIFASNNMNIFTYDTIPQMQHLINIEKVHKTKLNPRESNLITQ
jgi:hypothetical protein